VPRPGRNLDVRAYWRYGFQGMLKQSELSGSTTDISDYLTPFRSYDARAGRWRSHDPIFQPWESTYLGMAGNPAMMVDPWGLTPGGGGATAKPVVVVADRPKTGLPILPFFGSLPPTMPNVLDGAKKAQQKAQPLSFLQPGAERFVPDWLKNQGKTFWEGFGDAFMAEANDALDGIKNAPEAIQEAWSAFLADPTGFVWDFVKAGLRDLGETLDLIQLRSNPRHPYEVGKDNGKLAFRALGFLGGAGLTGLAARAPKLLKLLKGKRPPKGDAPNLAAVDDVAGGGANPSQLALPPYRQPSGGLVIGRGAELDRPFTIAPNEFRLSWPSTGSTRLEWKVNSGLLRTEMRKMVPIRDASVGNVGGMYLNAERNLLQSHGWKFNSATGCWNPPGN